MIATKPAAARIAGALAGALLLAGCAEPPQKQKGAGAPPPSGGAEQLNAQENSVLASLETVEQGSYYLHRAHYQIIQQCLADRDITVYPSSPVSDPLMDVATQLGTPEAIALWYSHGKVPNSISLSAEPALADYGYSGIAGNNNGTDPRDQAYFALSREEQEKVQIALDGRDADLNQVAPFEESCIGQAYQVTSGDKDPFGGLSDSTMSKVIPILEGLSTPEGQASITQTPELKKARSTWESCMNGKGRAANWPPGKAVAAGEAKNASEAAQQLADEAAYANTDAACGQQSGINAAYRGAIKNWRSEQIKQHLTDLQAFFAVRDPQVAAAKKYLGIN